MSARVEAEKVQCLRYVVSTEMYAECAFETVSSAGLSKKKPTQGKLKVMANSLVVIENNDPTYADPIQVDRGDVLTVGEEDTDYPGWIWCENEKGKCGWVPDDCIETIGAISR